MHEWGSIQEPHKKSHHNTELLNKFKMSIIVNLYEYCRIRPTRCCTLHRAKNTPTRSFVSRTVNRK